MNPTGDGKIKSIQVLRAVAVLMVVYVHLMERQTEISGTSWQKHFHYLLGMGGAGVDIFFVISGFIITVISGKYAAAQQPGFFFVKRLIRIVPVYWIVSIFLVIRLFVSQHLFFEQAEIIKTVVFFPFF